MAGPGERIELPNGKALFYVDEDHSYWRCKPDGKRGQRLTGVTTVVKPLDFKPDNLMKWAANLNCDGVAELAAAVLQGTEPDQLPDALAWLVTGDGIRDALQDGELTWQHLRDRKAVVGTNVHEIALRALAMGRPVPDLEALTDEERGKANGIIAFWLDHDPKPELVEQIVLGEDLGVAGRLDLLGDFGECDDALCACHLPGDRGLVDAKTGGFISDGAHAQVAGYRKLVVASGYEAPDWQAILQVTEEGTYDLIPCTATVEDFEVAVDAYRRAGRIGREAGKRRRDRRGSRKAVAA
jgi:hypothetical protein